MTPVADGAPAASHEADLPFNSRNNPQIATSDQYNSTQTLVQSEPNPTATANVAGPAKASISPTLQDVSASHPEGTPRVDSSGTPAKNSSVATVAAEEQPEAASVLSAGNLQKHAQSPRSDSSAVISEMRSDRSSLIQNLSTVLEDSQMQSMSPANGSLQSEKGTGLSEVDVNLCPCVCSVLVGGSAAHLT